MGAALTDDIKTVVRPLGRARGESQFCRETTLKVRQPFEHLADGTKRPLIGWRDWETKMGPLVDEWLDSGRCAVLEAGGIIAGFALWRDPRTLAMLYVKAGLRGQGFGMRLLKEWPRETLQVIQPTPCWRRWCEHHKLAWEVSR